jgi:hypothetical protein
MHERKHISKHPHPYPLLCAPRVELQVRFELLVVDRHLLVLFLGR